MVLFGCVLAWKTRNLGSALGEAKQLLFAMYNVGLVALIVLLMGSFLTVDQKSVYVIMTVGIFWSTVFSSCAFVLPRLLQIQRNGMRRRTSSQSRASSYYYNNKPTGSISSSFQTSKRILGPADASSASIVATGGSMFVEPRSKMVSSSSLHSSDYNVELKTSPSEPWTLSNEVSRDTIDCHSSFSALCDSDQDDDDGGSDSDDGEEKETTQSRRTSFTRVPSGKSVDSVQLQDEDIEASIVFE